MYITSVGFSVEIIQEHWMLSGYWDVELSFLYLWVGDSIVPVTFVSFSGAPALHAFPTQLHSTIHSSIKTQIQENKKYTEF